MVKVSEIAQLQELIDFYRSKLLLICDHTYSNHLFFKNMLYSLTCCRQEYVLQCRITSLGYASKNYFQWFITYTLFGSVFRCIETALYQLLQVARPDILLEPEPNRRDLGRLCRMLAETTGIAAEYLRSFDLLDVMNTRIQKHNNYAEGSSVALTTYNNQPYVSTYGYSVELINPALLFAILKDVGELLATHFSSNRTQQVNYYAEPKRQSSV
ncbi:hypothetical protein [Sporomusa acidovorans]|uniref:Uncharacterized protein n=1 Tax=Sporomusa acidovorans (strain ATCC 49682 / DSM 3132 / Mol) TaxID=1123286 RepID=A0ABZ3J039_SPOA4|nr:hypothetical protein [Sporomusa acidovorans]OZC21969.1 hypothetical protein SPACI_16520 [Sporomusa acidovorans DSM 3132]SDF65206.1 hypothetical protein SAMN04488499_106525 [Sporomusa acidovorans]